MPGSRLLLDTKGCRLARSRAVERAEEEEEEEAEEVEEEEKKGEEQQLRV